MATTATSNQVADNSSLANFKAWAQAISNAFSTFGWTQTADTGQVNWGSIASVPSSTYVYEIWKAADAAAATTPIYLKMEYGFSSTQVGVRVTVGTGSNGSGTITGATSFNSLILNFNNSVIANQGATAYSCYFSGNAGEFRMLMWVGNNTAVMTFGIERSKDATGAVTTDYFTAINVNNTTSATSQARQQTTLTGSTVTVAETTLISCGLSANNGTGAFGGTVAAFPVFPLIGKLGNPMLGFMTCVASDVADGVSVTVATMYGATHTYIACKTSTTLGGFQRQGVYASNGSANAMLMRYE